MSNKIIVWSELSEKQRKDNIKKKWIEALRSGKYAQGLGALRRDNSYCCLGVLCDISPFGNQWAHSATSSDGELIYTYFGERDFLPDEVAEWAGLDTKNPRSGRTPLSVLNDYGESFESIADIIEAEL